MDKQHKVALIKDGVGYVTHADYKALEDACEAAGIANDEMAAELKRLTAELAECRNLITGLRHELAQALK